MCRRPVDRGGGLAEGADLSSVGDGGGRDQVDEHFGGRLVESKQCNRFSFVDLEVLHAQGTQAVIVLLDAAHIDDDVARVSHEARQREDEATRRRAASLSQGRGRATDRRENPILR